MLGEEHVFSLSTSILCWIQRPTIKRRSSRKEHQCHCGRSILHVGYDGIYLYLFYSSSQGVVPIIRAPRNGAAEVVATQLDTKIHDHLANVGNLFENTTTFQRPGTVEARSLILNL